MTGDNQLRLTNSDGLALELFDILRQSVPKQII